ncbi:MAG: DUF3810 domain-containing protein [Bacteroidetes bacterium]|nr:MAG: DUF3810 domain-containing protein [Bacteroidota bacterium]
MISTGKRSLVSWMVPIFLVVAIKIFSLFPGAVERYYATGIYPVLARLLRVLFGWLPFSIGDILYLIVAIWLVVGLIIFFKKLFRRELTRSYFQRLGSSFLRLALYVYIIFNLFWGLNYNRRGIAYQLELEVKPYSTRDLCDVVQTVVQRLNDLDSVSRIERPQLKERNFLFASSVESYRILSDRDLIFTYPSPSVKSSMFSTLGNYLGFTGYYNPFSGEAQVNTTVPVFIQPFTTCHEIGHQLGYAKENEANFAGYLSGKSSSNMAFRYSVYFDVYIYAASQLYVRDSTLAITLRNQLRPAVRKDFLDLRKFFTRYESPLEPFIRRLYGRYLKANNQPQGILTYDEVVAWLVAYTKRYGNDAL